MEHWNQPVRRRPAPRRRWGLELPALWPAIVLLLFLGGCTGTQTSPREGPATASADGLYFVQFHHPGWEHEPDLPGEKSWNLGPHRRKFMLTEATWLAAPGRSSEHGKAVFWGEWEPPSVLVKTFVEPVPYGPRYLFEPVLDPFWENDPPLMNTDPVVFGGPFLYGNCKQNDRKGEPTDLQRLGRGSVVLFGSNREAREFQLDTVLVVEDWRPYSTEEWREALDDWAFPEYLEISPRAISYELGVLEPGKVRHYRLYHGATAAAPLGGMFSYFPCKPWDGSGQGFSRPIIRLEGLIDGRIEHGQRMNPQASPVRVRALWEEVTRQVLAQDLALCVAAPLPERRPAPHSRKASHAPPPK